MDQVLFRSCPAERAIELTVLPLVPIRLGAAIIHLPESYSTSRRFEPGSRDRSNEEWHREYDNQQLNDNLHKVGAGITRNSKESFTHFEDLVSWSLA